MSDQREVLPLKEAYAFAAQHGLRPEVAKIRKMEINAKWRLSQSKGPSLRRGYVVDLFTKRGLIDLFQEQCWPAGTTPTGESNRGYCLRLKGRYESFLAKRAAGA